MIKLNLDISALNNNDNNHLFYFFWSVCHFLIGRLNSCRIEF